MAKLTITFLLFFLVVVSFSHARHLTDQSENEVSFPDSASDSDSKASIFLPSEKSSEYKVAIAEPDQVRTEVNPSEITSVDSTDTGSDPVVMITFRPLNRQFERRPVPLVFRRGRRGCHHRHNFKPWRLIDRVGQISYGNDMIVSDEQSSPNSDANWGSYSEMKIPSRWSEFRHVGPWDSFRSDLKEDRKYLLHQYFRHHHHRQEEEEDEHKEKSGFLRNFRKFLNQFEF